MLFCFRYLSLLSSFLVVCLFVISPANAHPDEKILLWVEEVILGPEFGGAGKVCSRWAKGPSLSIFGATPQQEEVVVGAVVHLNYTLAQTPIKQIVLLKANDTDADIRIYFAPLKELPTFAEKHNFYYAAGNWGYFWTFWNYQHEIERGFVLLASDRLKDKQLRHFALEEITQVLGLSNDSPIFPESIFYAMGNDGGNAQQLSKLDKKLITFFYNHILPGAKQADVRTAFKQYWPKQ